MNIRHTLIVMAALGGSVFGQLDRGTLTGTVTDSSGAGIPGARVVIRQLATSVEYAGQVNEAGQWTRPNLPAGEYRIEVDATGFKKQVRTGVVLRVADVLRVDAQLEIGSVAESVEVSADVPRVQTDSAEVGTALSNKSLLTLPLSFSSGRSAENFAYVVTPGVNGTRNEGHINGSTAHSKEMLVDGASVTVNQSGNYAAALVSLEALQEVKVQTSGLSAEFGRTQGGVFNFVMKSGSNQIHGSSYFGLRNEAFNANTFSNKAAGLSRPQDRKLNYAGSFGGPVVLPKIYNGRNRTFFYMAYERYRERNFGLSAPNRTVPVPEFYEGDFSRLLGGAISQRDALGNAVLQGSVFDPKTFRQLANGRWVGDMFPGNRIPVSRFSAVSKNLNQIAMAGYLPTVKDASGRFALQNNASFPIATQPEWDHFQFSVKLDQVLTPSQRLAFSMNRNVSPRLILDAGGMWDPSQPEGGPLAKARRRDDSGAIGRLGHDWTVSPRLLNNFTLSFNHRGNPQLGTQYDLDGAAKLGIKGLTTTGYPAVNWGGGPFVPLESPGFISDSYRADLSWGVLDTVSFSAGRHFLKAGIDHRRNHQNRKGSPDQAFTFAARGTAIPNEAFSGNLTGYSFASYLLGIVDNASQADPVPLGGRRHYWALFIQDDFKVSPRLSLNLGLRWEYQPPVFEVADRMSSWNSSKIDPVSGLPGAYDFAGDCSVCTGKRYFGTRDFKNFGPRFGFAWRGPMGLVVRGAYGILYDADSFNAYNPTPLGKPTNVQAGGTYSLNSDPVTPWAGIFNWDNGFPQDRYQEPGYDVSWGNRNRPGTVDPGYGLTPYSQQWNFNIQREVARRTVIDAGYIGVKGTRLRTGDLARVNQLPPALLAQYGTRLNTAIRNQADANAAGIKYPFPGFVGTVASALRPYPQVQGNQTVQMYGSPLGFSNHHALQVTINRETKKGLTLYANYVWSKTMTNVESSLVGDNGSRPLDYYNLKLEKSVAEHDTPHMVKGYIAYDLPYKGSGIRGAVLGGWAVSGILNYFSGQPLGFTAPTPLSSGWNGAVNRANVAAGELKNASFDKANFDLANRLSPANTYLNKALFSAPAPLTLGTGARRYTQIRDFGTINEDVGLQKNLQITEKVRFQLRAEMLNVFNRHQLGGVNTSVNNSSFGQVTSVSGNRQIQLSSRIDF